MDLEVSLTLKIELAEILTRYMQSRCDSTAIDLNISSNISHHGHNGHII